MKSIFTSLSILILCSYFFPENPYFEIITHFRIQLFVFYVIVVILSWIRNKYPALLLFLILLIENFYQLASFSQIQNKGPLKVQVNKKNYRILVSNVNKPNQQYNRLIELIRREDPDVIVLIEPDAKWVNELKGIKLLYKQFHETNNAVGYFSFAVFSRYEIRNFEALTSGKLNIPFIRMSLNFPTGLLRLYSVHPSPPIPLRKNFMEDRNLQLADIRSELLKEKSPMMLVGDLNATTWSSSFRSLIRDTLLKTTYTKTISDGTWPTPEYFRIVFLPGSAQISTNEILYRALDWRIFRIPIDHVLVSDELKVDEYRLGSHIGSDHFPLLIDFNF